MRSSERSRSCRTPFCPRCTRRDARRRTPVGPRAISPRGATACWWVRCRATRRRTATANTCSTGAGPMPTPTRPPLLPQVGRRRAIHAGPRRARDSHPTPATRRALLRYATERILDERAIRRFTFCSPRRRSRSRRAPLGMIPRPALQFHWSNPGYRDFADFLAGLHARQAKEGQAGAAQGSPRPACRFERRRGRDDQRGDWEFFYRCYDHTYREHHSTPYLTASLLRPHRRDASPTTSCSSSVSREGRSASAPRSASTTAQTLWGRYWGTARIRVRPALRGVLLPVDRVLHRAGPRALRRRRAGRAQACARPAAGDHALAARRSATADFARAIADFCARERARHRARPADELDASSPFRASHRQRDPALPDCVAC